MSISTTEQAVNKCAAAVPQLSLSVFHLIEALLYRMKGEADEIRNDLSFQICALFTSLLDLHAAVQRKHQNLSHIEKNEIEPIPSSDIHETVLRMIALLQQSDLLSKKECIERLVHLKDYYLSNPNMSNTIPDENERFDYVEPDNVAEEQSGVLSPLPVEESDRRQANKSASPPLMFTRRERKRTPKRS
ncbi:hypothetical protein [Paenibacillus planticolens]|uniref:Uncharacterized protein n=1 Tax=Paenibacillus planticolens TaxID=2654976 RepID=A0ABX1ZIQ6_9BACL|nr:hypothetical protein [Paenibacillus planticolens]NOU98939.1 hypothetical protein [Paenibacillus planticolens]